MFLANGEKFERRLQESIKEHEVWRKQSKNEAHYIIKILQKVYKNTFKENNTEGINNGCNHQAGGGGRGGGEGGGGEEEDEEEKKEGV